MKKIVLFCALVASCSILAACSSKSSKDGLIDSKKLYVSTNAEFAPYEYHEQDKIVGIDIDIANEIAKKLNVELVINDTAFDSLIPEVSSGKADIVMAGMTVTEDRKKNVDFSKPYAKSSQVIIVKEGSDIKSAADLENKLIGVQLGTIADIYSSEIKNATVERYSKFVESLQALAQGKIDAVVMDLVAANEYIKEQNGLVILPEALMIDEYAIAYKKGNTVLKDKIDAILNELQADGTIDNIFKKYLITE